MTVEEMEERMSSAEFSDWFEFFRWREFYHKNPPVEEIAE